jgi:ubiquitin-activating enzyme E1
VDIWDSTLVSIEDLGANFYLTEADVGKRTRADSTISKLQELNNYVKVEVAKEALGLDLLMKYHCVVFTEVHTNLNDIITWNKALREQKKVTILTQAMGLYGYIFSDFCSEHSIIDPDGERVQNFIVSDIEKQEKDGKTSLIVFVHEDKRHSFSDDSWVKFREIEGMTHLNDLEPVQIKVLNGYSFRIDIDTSNLSDYTGGGIVEDVKVPVPHRFNSLEIAISKPLETNRDGMFPVFDFSDFERPGHLHLAFQAIHGFRINNQRWPEDKEEDVAQVLALAE